MAAGQATPTYTRSDDFTIWHGLAVLMIGLLVWHKLFKEDAPRPRHGQSVLFPAGTSHDGSGFYHHVPHPGDHYVAGYRRSDGTWVRGHYRTNSDHTRLNNYSGPYGSYYRQLNGR